MGRPARSRELTGLHEAIAARLKPYAKTFQGGISGLHRKLIERKAPGVKYRPDLQKKLGGSGAISSDLLYHLCDVLRVNPGWALTGLGEPDLPIGSELYSPTKTADIVRTIRARDHDSWRERFSRAMTSPDPVRREELGAVAAHAVLAELDPDDYHRPAKLQALVKFAARVAHPGRVRRLADTMAGATRLLMRLDGAFLAEAEAGNLHWPRYGAVREPTGLVFGRLYDDVLAAAYGFLVTIDPNDPAVIRLTRIAEARLPPHRPRKRSRPTS